MWNSLSIHVVSADTINTFKDHLDKFWSNQDALYDYKADLAFKIARLVHQSLAGAAPAYLADDCHLLSDAGRRTLRSHSNDIRKPLVPRTHNKFGERSAIGTAVARTFLRFLQTIFENTSLWRLKRLASLPTYRCYINKCIYLSIYLSPWHRGP